MLRDKVFVMHNDVEIPYIGFGTWQIPNEEAYDSVTAALKNGYRHIDTAMSYRNETEVGRAIREFDVPREEIFLTSKLQASIKDYDAVLEAFDKSITDLGVDYVDLWLIHAPWPWDEKGSDYTEGNIQAWKAMEKLHKEGKIRSIGVSNFSVSDIQALLDNCDIVPMVNQIPFYIGRDQEDLLAFCKEHNIVVEAYSPLATGDLLDDPELNEMADKYGVTVAQLAIRYCLERDTLPLPKSTHEERIIQNKEIDFQISPEDMEKLNAFKDVRG